MRFKKWNIGTPAERDVALLRSAGYPYLLSTVLAARGVTTAEAAAEALERDRSLSMSPMLMRDMDKAVARIQRAISQGETIAVFGDYDVDGITSTVLLMDYLKSCGVRCLRLCAGVDGAACRRYGKLAADPEVNEKMKRNSHCFHNAGSFCLQLAEKFPVPVDFYGDGGKLRVCGQKFVGKGEVLPLVHGQKPADLHQIQKIVRPQIAVRFQPGV